MQIFKLLKSAVIAVILCSTAAMAQTGSFKVNIDFKGAPRQISFYVPATYDSTKPFGLFVGLHGLGDNSDNYRNAIITSLKFDTLFKNTIFIFPEASTVNTDYYLPAGHEEIITESIKYARSKYYIDDNNIILQGFSLGGRAALRFGLDNPEMFKGLLLHTPAVQGIKETGNRSVSKYTFNYANATKIPVYITIGRQDVFYSNIADSVFMQLVRHNGIVKLNAFPTLNHNVPSAAQLTEARAFFNEPASNQIDFELVEVKMPSTTCNSTATVKFLFRNTGKENIKTVEFISKNLNFPWQLNNLEPYQSREIVFNDVPVNEGLNTFNFSVGQVNGVEYDSISKKSVRTVEIVRTSNGRSLPYKEDFESEIFPPAGWVKNNSGEVYAEWDHSSNAGKNLGAAFTVNTILIFDNLGSKEELISPVLDLSSLPNPNLRFNVSYNYHKYTPPYVNADTIFADTLEVLISTNCGENYNSIYKKGGRDLATFKNPMTNITSMNGLLNNPRDTNWRHEALDLSAYSSAKNALLKFRYISALGGMIYLDNVIVGNSSLGFADAEENAGISVYPNPAKNLVYIKSNIQPIERVEFTDITGRILLTENNVAGNNTALQVNTSALKAGLYIVKAFAGGSTSSVKLFIHR